MKRHFDIIGLLRNYNFGDLLTAGVAELRRKFEELSGYYGQNGEDREIEKYVTRGAGKYIEIGAYHPSRLSNTYRFYKRGWRGLVVEPNPDTAGLFKKFRPDDKFLNIGIGGRTGGVLTYYRYLIPALNTFLVNQVRENKTKGHNPKEMVTIPVIPIKKVIDRHFEWKKCDLLSIDTEGMDEEILSAWPWKKIKPKVICCERGTGSEKVVNYLEKEGYRMKFSNHDNFIFVWQK